MTEFKSLVDSTSKHYITNIQHFKNLWYSRRNLLYGSNRIRPELVAKSLLIVILPLVSSNLGCFRIKDYIMNIMNYLPLHRTRIYKLSFNTSTVYNFYNKSRKRLHSHKYQNYNQILWNTQKNLSTIGMFQGNEFKFSTNLRD